VDLRLKLIQAPSQCQRRSLRLKDYDYTQEGAYFVTICTHGHKCLFGQIVHDEWTRTAIARPNVAIDAFIVMPNHLHGIIIINEYNIRRGDLAGRPYTPIPHGPPSNSISAMVGQFKSLATKHINALRGTPGTRVWQRNYYEHVIRNEDDLNEIRQYVLYNPVKWDIDENNPTRQLPEPPYDNMVGAQNFVPLRQGDKVCLTR
jgi:REP element-mobilizing transposase RayT